MIIKIKLLILLLQISLGMLNWKDKRLIEKLNLIYQEFINYLIENDFKVLLIPQLFGSQKDYKYLKSFEKKIKILKF